MKGPGILNQKPEAMGGILLFFLHNIMNIHFQK